MRMVRVALGAMLCSLIVSPAAADHDLPAKAKSVKVDLVRAHEACSVPNDTHDHVLVIAACSPATAPSSYGFGPAGTGTVQVQRAKNGIKFRFDVKDVRTGAAVPVNGVDFSGRVSMRITDDGCSGASCTFETFISVTLPCSGGRCVAKILYPGVFLPLGADAALEITGIDVRDDGGARFATQGILLP